MQKLKKYLGRSKGKDFLWIAEDKRKITPEKARKSLLFFVLDCFSLIPSYSGLNVTSINPIVRMLNH